MCSTRIIVGQGWPWLSQSLNTQKWTFLTFYSFFISKYNFFKIVWIQCGFLHRLPQTHCNLPHFHSLLLYILCEPFLNLVPLVYWLVHVSSHERIWGTPKTKPVNTYDTKQQRISLAHLYTMVQISSHLHIHRAASVF